MTRNEDPNDVIATDSPPSRRSLMILLPVVIFAGVAILFGLALRKGDSSRLPSTFIGRKAPEMTLPGMEGLRGNGGAVPGFSTADLRNGEPTIVNFFASWCAPCVQEHPLLVDLATRHGVRVFGVNYKDPPPGGRRFIGRYGNPYQAVGVDATGRAAIEWGVYGMPETFVVDGGGIVVFKHVGPLTRAVLQEALLPALAQAKQTEPVQRSTNAGSTR